MVMTDHLIAAPAAAGNLLGEFREHPPEEYRGEVVPYYPSPLPPTPRECAYLAVAQVGLGNNLTAGLPVLARETAGKSPCRPSFTTYSETPG